MSDIKSSVSIVIPHWNNVDVLSECLESISNTNFENFETIVVDNASTDNTSKIAEKKGAEVVTENRKGYGYACLKGLEHLAQNNPDIVVFLDGDYSDYAEDLDQIVSPIIRKEVVFCIGDRDKKLREKGSLTYQQIFGNKLACFLMKWLYEGKFSDLGPFRAIKWQSLQELKMEDKTYGWTIEMQLKVLRKKMSYKEINIIFVLKISMEILKSSQTFS